MKTVLFRADASSDIGFGHVSRCLAIAADLNPSFRSVLLSKSPSAGLVDRCQAEGIQCVSLPLDISEVEEAEVVSKEAMLLGADIICTDGYRFDQGYQETLKSSGTALVVIDDLKLGTYCADLIINHAPGAAAEEYQTVGPCEFLLGVEWLMLNPVFWLQEEVATDESVFVCLGGADPSGSTRRVLADLAREKDRPIQVVLGGMNTEADSIRATYSSSKNFTFFSSLSPAEMADLMARSAYGVCAASTVSLEYLVAGRELLLLKTEENQAGIYSGILARQLGTSFASHLPSALSCETRRLTQPNFVPPFEGLLA